LVAVLVPYPAESASTTILITAVYYDTYLTNEPEEAFRLMNVGTGAGDMTDWVVTDGSTEGTITLTGTLPPDESIWIAREADDFTLEFGFPPGYEYDADTDPMVPNLLQSGDFALNNTGDELVLKTSHGAIVDSVVYEGGEPTDTGWSGPGIYPYGGDTVGIERFAQGEQGVEAFGKEGQVLYRKLDQATGPPVPDTDTAADWAQATDDPIKGKKVQYPGWDLERYFRTETFTETAILTYAVAPANIYETVLAEINQATS
jgi:hypothetical protein